MTTTLKFQKGSIKVIHELNPRIQKLTIHENLLLFNKNHVIYYDHNVKLQKTIASMSPLKT